MRKASSLRFSAIICRPIIFHILETTKIKSQFPIFRNNPDIVYLDNAATTQKPQIVIDSETNFYENSNANVHRGIHELSEKATQAYENARRDVAKFINADIEELIFTSGTTDSVNKLANSLAAMVTNQETILITEAEHHSNMLPWQALAQRTGAKLEYVKLTKDLAVDIEDLTTKLENNRVKILALSQTSNVTGTNTPINEAVALAKVHGTLVAVDGAQTIAHMPVDVKNLGVDFYSFSGHKMYGPTGIGVLWGKKDLLEQIAPLSYGGGMIEFVQRQESSWAAIPERHEAGTPNIAGAIGLAEAAKFITNIGFEAIIAHEQSLVKYALGELNKIDEIAVYGPKNPDIRSGVIAFNVKDIHPHDVAQILADNHVAVRAGHHCCQILHREVLQVPSTVRASIAIYNTEKDIDKLVSALKNIINQFK